MAFLWSSFIVERDSYQPSGECASVALDALVREQPIPDSAKTGARPRENKTRFFSFMKLAQFRESKAQPNLWPRS
jgi:hypothetical protein